MEEDLRIPASGAMLASTLIKPDSPPPWPAVVLVHGSGRQTRTGQDYRSLGYFLARQGVAALLYDRRGKGASSGRADRILPIAVLGADVLAVVEGLASRADIDGKRIGLLGISQGGWVVPQVASRSSKVAFVIAVSAAGVTPDRQNSFVVSRDLRRRLGDILGRTQIPSHSLELVLANETRRLEETESRRSPDAPEIVPGFSRFDPAPAWSAVKVPVLALWGAEDEVVPVEESRRIIDESLRSSTNPEVTLVTIPGADHSLRRVRRPADGWDWPRMSPDRDRVIAAWVAEHVRGSAEE